MADKSFAWAASRGLLRKNAVHGEEEARLVLKDYFQFNNEKGSMQTAKASGEVEDQFTILYTCCDPFAQRTYRVAWGSLPKHACRMRIMGFWTRRVLKILLFPRWLRGRTQPHLSRRQVLLRMRLLLAMASNLSILPLVGKTRVRIGILEHVERQPLRYVLPSLSKNESPLTLVPTFLQVLGRSGCRNSTAGQLIDGFEYA